MTPRGFVEFADGIQARHDIAMSIVSEFEPAPVDVSSTNDAQDAYAEAIFIRAFTAYENDLERLFLHYVTGGATLRGASATTYLNISDEALARKLTKGGAKFLSWAKPSETRNTAGTYIRDGWPINNVLSAKSQPRSDCEKVRNRIAHNSLEASIDFNSVQRNMLNTERPFPISPGQFLRIRSSRLRKLHMAYYLEVMRETIEGIMDPPP